MTRLNAPTLVRLGTDAPLPSDGQQDLRGRRVFARGGEEIGVVDDLLLDEGERRVRLLRVAVRDLLSPDARHVLVPVEAIRRIEHDRVHLDPLRERVLSAPLDDPSAPSTPDRWAGLYDYYGCEPFWTAG